MSAETSAEGFFKNTNFQAAKARPARSRSRDAFDRSVAVFRAFRDLATAEEMERIATALEQALKPSLLSSNESFEKLSDKTSSQQTSLVSELTGGRTYSENERLALEAASIARFFEKRRELLADSLSATEAARLLGTSRQTPHDRTEAGTMLGVHERGGLRFPRWQFDPEGPNGVIAGLPLVLSALEVSQLAKAAWFVRPNTYLESRTPLEVLKSGEIERLVLVARAVEVS